MPLTADRRSLTPAGWAAGTNPRWHLVPHLALINRALMGVAAGRIKRLAVFLPPRHGKALALGTALPTPTGWTTMGEVAVGDWLLDEAGQPCRGVAKSPVWTGRQCYEVVTNDGARIVADEAHEWLAKLDSRSRAHVHDTATLARARSKRAQVQVAAPLALPEADLLVDPYVLGVWLGDGAADQATISCDPLEAQWMRGEIERRGYVTKGRATYATFGVDGLKVQLRALGVLGRKHVPAQYLRASAAQRLALLQGLVDTDGYVSPTGQVEVCATNPDIAQAVHELVVSLGRKAAVLEGDATFRGRSCGPKYRVMFYMRGAALMPRKAARCRDALNAGVRYVTAHPVASEPTQCIQVDSPSSLFLAGRDMVPTHNSELVSGKFPSWCMGVRPDWRVILTSYEATFAETWGGLNRDALEEYGPRVFGVHLKSDTTSKGNWRLAEYDGRMSTAGVGGSLTGKGAHLFIIDDPVKNDLEALSATYRDRMWNWWQATASTRLEPDGAVVLVQTRWHEDDLAGRILKHAAETGEEWTVISLPAIAEEDEDFTIEGYRWQRKAGEALWPERYSAERLAQIKLGMSAYWWNALYQQRPTPPGGDVIKREHFRYYERTPQERTVAGNVVTLDAVTLLGDPAEDEATRNKIVQLNSGRKFQVVDLADSEKKSADWTVVGTFMLVPPNRLLLLDMVRGHWGGPDTIANIVAQYQKWQPAWVGVETVAFQGSIVKHLRRGDPGNRRPPLPVREIKPKGDKVSRAMTLDVAMEGWQLWLPRWATFLGELEEEMVRFPRGKHDDMVDVMGYAAQEVYAGPQGNITIH